MLASASPRRVQLLEQIGIVLSDIDPAGVEETPHPGETARNTAARLALAKAVLVGNRPAHADAFVLAADTVVSVGRRQLGKADTEDEARRCLGLLSGRRHLVTTAVVLRAPSGKLSARVAETAVGFSRLTARQIDRLIEAGDWRGKAGGYAIQGHAASVARFLSGSHSGVVGLPLFETAQLLRGHGLLP